MPFSFLTLLVGIAIGQEASSLPRLKPLAERTYKRLITHPSIKEHAESLGLNKISHDVSKPKEK